MARIEIRIRGVDGHPTRDRLEDIDLLGHPLQGGDFQVLGFDQDLEGQTGLLDEIPVLVYQGVGNVDEEALGVNHGSSGWGVFPQHAAAGVHQVLKHLLELLLELGVGGPKLQGPLKHLERLL